MRLPPPRLPSPPGQKAEKHSGWRALSQPVRDHNLGGLKDQNGIVRAYSAPAPYTVDEEVLRQPMPKELEAVLSASRPFSPQGAAGFEVHMGYGEDVRISTPGTARAVIAGLQSGRVWIHTSKFTLKCGHCKLGIRNGHFNDVGYCMYNVPGGHHQKCKDQNAQRAGKTKSSDFGRKRAAVPKHTPGTQAKLTPKDPKENWGETSAWTAPSPAWMPVSRTQSSHGPTGAPRRDAVADAEQAVRAAQEELKKIRDEPITQ